MPVARRGTIRSQVRAKIVPVNDLRPEGGVEALFPTHGAISEEQQIGRDKEIAALEARVHDHGDALLLHPRKQGKSTVALAATRRVATSGGIVAEVDITQAGVNSGPSLARALLASLHSKGAHLGRAFELRSAVSKQKGRIGRIRKTASAASQLGVDEGHPLAVVLEELPIAHEPTLDEVLDQIASLGEKIDTAVFLDELQEIGKWRDTDEVQAALARFARRPGRRVSLIVAGSEQSATEALFAEGRPLHYDIDFLRLEPIDDVDWHREITARFRRAGHQIGAERIRQILAATNGHPLRTMSVAKHTLRNVRDAGEPDVGYGAVAAAIDEASSHPSWTT
jgi:hypothetical protein